MQPKPGAGGDARPSGAPAGDSGDAVGFISRSTVFGALPAAAREFLADKSRLARYPTGMVVGSEGAHGGFLFGVVSGKLRCLKLTAEGRRIIFTYLKPGEWGGFYWALRDGTAVMDVEAAEPSTCLKIDRESLLDAANRWPQVYEGLFFELLQRTRSLYSLLELGVAHPLEVRVAAILCTLLNRHKKATPQGLQIDLPIGQADLAGLAFCSRQRLNRVLGQWVDRGILSVEARKHIVVHDLPALEAEMHRTGL